MNHHGMHPNPERSTVSTMKIEDMAKGTGMENIKRNHSSGSFSIRAKPLKCTG